MDAPSQTTSPLNRARPERDETPCQLNVRLPRYLRDAFAKVCTAGHKDQSEVLFDMITAYTENSLEVSIRHLDGRICPMSSLMIELAVALKPVLAGACRQ